MIEHSKKEMCNSPTLSANKLDRWIAKMRLMQHRLEKSLLQQQMEAAYPHDDL